MANLPYPRMRDTLGRTTELRQYLYEQYSRFICREEEAQDCTAKDHPLCWHVFERFGWDTVPRYMWVSDEEPSLHEETVMRMVGVKSDYSPVDDLARTRGGKEDWS